MDTFVLGHPVHENLFHANEAGMKFKDEGLKNKIKYFESNIFSINETHYTNKGKLKIDNFEMFEAIRKKRDKGGTLLGIHKGLNPILINEYSDRIWPTGKLARK